MRATNTPATVSELERVIEVMKPYISECNLLDVVHSEKFGYILLSLPPKDKLGDAELIPLDKPETLLDRLYTELAYDFMELEGHCGDYTEAGDGTLPKGEKKSRPEEERRRPKIGTYCPAPAGTCRNSKDPGSWQASKSPRFWRSWSNRCIKPAGREIQIKIQSAAAGKTKILCATALLLTCFAPYSLLLPYCRKTNE